MTISEKLTKSTAKKPEWSFQVENGGNPYTDDDQLAIIEIAHEANCTCAWWTNGKVEVRSYKKKDAEVAWFLLYNRINN